MGITIFYSIFYPNINFLKFNESYLDFLGLIDTGGNGKLNLLTYPLSLYLICAVTCIGYLISKKLMYLDFLILIWSVVLFARLISILLRGNPVFDVYFYVGILPEFIVSPFLVYIKSKIT